MNTNDLIRLRTKIVALIAGLEITAANAKSALRESSEVTASVLLDSSDAVKGEIDLKNTLKVHNHSVAQQNILRDALERMEVGTFGMCTECGEEISFRRLEAMPGAALCIHCQQELELDFDAEPKIFRDGYAVPVRSAA